MEYKDYYKIMGVDKKATEREIKQAYRRLARKHHPDVNPGNKEAEAKFKEINEAYEVPGDPEKRKKYDELGANWKYYEQWQKASGQPFDWSQFGSAPGQGGNVRYEYHTMTEEDLKDIFSDSGPFSSFYYTFFGTPGPETRRQQWTAHRPHRGQDLEQPVEVSLEEAYGSTTRVLQMTDASKIALKLGGVPVFGAFVGRVTPGSPRAKAGLMQAISSPR